MTPSPWPALVAGVKHSAYCDHWRKACMGTIDLYLRCSCDRDARIGRGIDAAFAATGVFDKPGQVVTDMATCRARAFEAAT